MHSKPKLLVSGALLRALVLTANIVSAFILMPFIIHSIGDYPYSKKWKNIVNYCGRELKKTVVNDLGID